MKKKFLALWLAIALVLSPAAVACNSPTNPCPPGQVLDGDGDDADECEDDEGGHGKKHKGGKKHGGKKKR